MFEDRAAGWSDGRHLTELLQDLLGKAVFGLDRHLQRRLGVFCYTFDPRCVFRISFAKLEQSITLTNGHYLDADSALVDLHLWNEQLPVLSMKTSPIAWGVQMSRALAHSLQLLSRYLFSRCDCDGIAAVRADMAFATPEETEQLLRICGRYGFRPSREGENLASAAHRYGENILISMMVLARNARALRPSSIRRGRVRVFLTRDELDDRFGDRTCSLRARGYAL